MANLVVSGADVVTTESAGFAEFVLRLDRQSSDPVSVRYLAQSGSAQAYSDFAYTGQEVLTFAPGETVKTARIALFDDATPETAETFQLALSVASGSNVTLGTSATTATILDNDGAPGTPVVSVADTVVDEKAGRAYFTVTLDRRSTSPVSMTYRTAQGTAEVGKDYEGLTARSLTFAPSERAKTVAVNLVDDGIREDGEYFDLLLSDVSGALMPDTRGRAFIGPSDQPVSAKPAVVSVSDTVVNESAGFAEFVFRLDTQSSDPVSVRYLAQSGSAQAYSDFAYTGQEVLTFAPGETVKTARIALFDDATPETAETFQLALSVASGSNVTLGTSAATATILDDQGNPLGQPIISAADTIADEKAGRAYFTVTLDRPSTSIASVNYQTAYGSATPGVDYQPQSKETLVFAPGERSKTVAVNVLDDGIREDGEYFDLLLSDVSGALMPDTRGRAFIGPSDQPVSAKPAVVSVSDTVVNESAGFAEFVFRLDTQSSDPVSVRYLAQSGSAQAYSDFAYTGQEVLTFAPGETVKTARVALFDDATPETAETFQLALSVASGSNVTLGTSAATATILDDQGNPLGQPIISAADTIADEKAGRAYFTVTLDRPSTSPVSLKFRTIDGSGVAGSDYQGLGVQTLAIAPGERVKMVAVNMIDDLCPESGESLQLLLFDPVGAQLGTTLALASISDDDSRFDPAYYLEHNPDVAASKIDPRTHYLSSGWAEGRDPNASVDLASVNGLNYIASHPDLAGAFGPNKAVGYQHFATAGMFEGRHTTFNGLEYLASHGDLMNVFGANADAGAAHYIQAGRFEGRAATFSGLEYIASHQDLMNVFGANADAGAAHYIQAGRFEGRASTFDGLAYTASYGDLVTSYGVDLDAGVTHYIEYGRAQGRTITFNGLEYIASHPDLINALHDQVAANPNPDLGTDHYLRAGYFENRAADQFDAARYLANYADLRSVFGTNTQAATVHFITAGYFEGRTA